MKKVIGLFVLLTLNFTLKISAQGFDSAKVYPLCMNSTFYTSIDREDIKFVANTVFCLKTVDADSLYVTFQNRIKSDYIKTLPWSRSYIDIRLSIDFYKNGKVTSNISVTTGKKLTIDNKMYSYTRKDLKQLNSFIPSISKKLCVD